MVLRARHFMNGVQLYLAHPVRRGPEEAPVIWRAGSTTLRDFAPRAFGAPPVLILPPLCSRFTIMDLQGHHSFVRYLTEAGLRPLVVDWGAPQDDEVFFTLDDYMSKRLIPVLQIVSVAQPAHVLGYSFGGVLAVALACLFPERVRSLALLATPWDFHDGYEALGQDGQSVADRLAPWLAENGLLSVEVMQSLNTALQPLHAFRRFSSFAFMDQESDEAARFVLTEDWLNDGVPLTIPVAREYFREFSGRNALAKNKWRVGGKTIDPVGISVPCYAVVPGKDSLIPPQSAMPLAQRLPRALRHEPMMGTIGLMASPYALYQVWKPLSGWMTVH